MLTPLARSSRALACLFGLGLVASCGARTALEVPDGSIDAAPGPSRDGSIDSALRGDAFMETPRDVGQDAPPDVPFDACSVITLPLTPVRAEVMFVLDRSTSMGWGLTGPMGGGPSRWSILVDALREQLPRYDLRSDMGLLLYPLDDGMRCTVGASPQLEPLPGNAAAVLGVVTASAPGGRTPTADGLDAARRYFASHPDVSRARAVVLATDGAPNCNAALDGARCPCTGGAGLPIGTCGTDDTLCLDDARTISVIEGLAGDGVPTYVIGIDGDPDPALIAVLTRMALAGERPNPLDPRAFYSVRRAGDLAAAFDRIQASIVSCSLSFEGGVPEGRGVEVTMDGEPLVRDPARIEGWEWSDELAQTIVLHGETCSRAQEGVHRLELDVLCGP